MRTNHKSGFTLVELSIVIVIIGLIVAGITAGRSLVDSTKLRTVITEINQIKTSINAFRLEYDQLPGDMKNAYDYWGTACDAVADDCNGNNNRMIELGNGTTASEVVRVWQHLTLAKVFPGSYDGEAAESAKGTQSEVFFSKSGYYRAVIVSLQNNWVFGTGATITPQNTVIYLGGMGNNWHSVAFTVKQAKSIDTKIDDGIANSGKVIAPDGDGNVTPKDCSEQFYTAGGADFNTANLSSDEKYCKIHVFL